MQLLDQTRELQTETLLSDDETPSSQSIRNFLFLIPENVTELERAVVLAAARRMTEHGYVYLAESGRKDVEDCHEVRHLPLNAQHLPSFGLTTTVVVLNREELARKALETYPDAQVFLLNLRSAFTAGEESTATAGTCHYFSHLRPWLVTGQMAAIRN
ncbi:MAG: hypothetical protein JWO08_2254 [Verrucomicrobiaceae bacterium]|nr:hypothetical protein [Verrucomicrobiaceae bacterium]